MKPVRSSSPDEAIVQQELRLLGRVTSALSQMSADHPGTPDYDAELVNLRDQVAEAKPEDIPALVEQMTRIAAIAQRYGRGRDLPVDPASPYFAHLRLAEDARQRDVLIGKRGFIDRSQQVQIVDWRNAPVSRIYYRYEEGDDYEERFGDRLVEGQVTVRRTVTIEDGHLRRVGAPQGTFFTDSTGRWYHADSSNHQLAGGQGSAVRPPAVTRGSKRSQLGGGRLRPDKHLPEIAALIDPTQFELITRPDSGLVVLQGGAGTGKTTVALHRVAYLNYAAPKIFRPDRMLIVVPTPAMARYVERVLPPLGVSGVRVMTLRRWLSRTRARALPHRGTERTYNDDTPAVVMRLKKHPLLLDLAREHVAEQQRSFERDLRSSVSGRPGADRVLDQWNALADRPLVRRCVKLRDWARQERDLPSVTRHQAESTAERLARRGRDVFEDWAELLTDRSRLFAAVARYSPGAFTERELEQVCSWCLLQCDEAPSIDRRRERAGRSEDAEDDTAEQAPFISLDGKDERDQPHAGRLDPPDDALLLYLHQLKLGAIWPPGRRAVRHSHLVVDEAQDLSALELSVLLGSSTDRRCITLAGDAAQRLVFDNSFTDWETLLDRLGVSASTNTTLRLGYRSTSEVMALARSLLGDLALPASTSESVRSGAPVEIHRFGSQGEAVATLATALRSLVSREPLASVALIARHRAQAASYAEALTRAEVPGVRLVDHDFSFKPGIEATWVSQVKGLEFDYVVLLDVDAANYPDTIESRHLLHIAATRAAHQLWIVTTSTPSPVLPETADDAGGRPVRSV